jgi:hypothetical protein
MADEELEGDAPAAVEEVPQGPFAAPRFLESCMYGKLGRIQKYLEDEPDQLDLQSQGRGWSLLQVAAGYGKPEIVKYLLGKGANATLTDKMGMTALHTAADSDAIEVIDMLLEKLSPDDINAVDQVPDSPPCCRPRPNARPPCGPEQWCCVVLLCSPTQHDPSRCRTGWMHPAALCGVQCAACAGDGAACGRREHGRQKRRGQVGSRSRPGG